MSIPQLTEKKKYTILLEEAEKNACFHLRSIRESEEIPFQQLVGRYKVLNVFNTLLGEDDGKLVVPLSKLKKVRQYLAMFSNGLLGNLVEIKIPAEIEKIIQQSGIARAKGYSDPEEGLADIILDDGHRGETIPVPSRPDNYPNAGPVIKNKEYVTLKDLSYKVRRGASNSACEFLEEAERLAEYEGEASERIPFTCYYPTYEAMTEKQRNWYFWWRYNARRKDYLETDLSYVFVHIYELINLKGTQSVRNGYDQLVEIWQHYRNTYPKLDNYMTIWIHDYILFYSCEFTGQDALTILNGLSMTKTSIDWIIKYFSGRPLDRIPFKIFQYLSDFLMQNSKFYYDGRTMELESLFGSILARTEVFLSTAYGKGILEYFGPGVEAETKRFPFPGAIFNNSGNKTINVAVRPFSAYKPLRTFITAIMKLSENKLREINKVKGRLKTPELGPELQQFIDTQLNAAVKRLKKAEPKVQISVDRNRIAGLIQESDRVRERLLEGIEDKYSDIDQKPGVFDKKPDTGENTGIDSRIIITAPIREAEAKGKMAELDLSELPPEWKEFFNGLESYQIEALGIISGYCHETGKAALSRICDQYLVLPQMLIDMINNTAMDTIGDLLIDTGSPEPGIFDEYNEIVDKFFHNYFACIN